MKQVILLRGVNVGGKNRVEMAAFRQLLTGLGCRDVRTYIQSGNAAVECDLPEDALAEAVRGALRAELGVDAGVMTRTAAQWHALTEMMPFSPLQLAQAEAADAAIEHEYLYFLDAPLPQALQDRLCAMEEGDDVRVIGREIYLLCRRSIRLSKTAAGLTRLAPDATARNRRTVSVLDAMVAGTHAQ